MAILQPSEYKYIADGVTKVFPIAFPYLRKEEVHVRLDGLPAFFTVSASNQAVLESTPTAGTEVHIFRSTDARDPRHEFQHGSPLLPRNLDTNFKQMLYVIQEVMNTLIDSTDDSIQKAIEELLKQLQAYTPVVDVYASFTLSPDYAGKWIRVHTTDSNDVIEVSVPREGSGEVTWNGAEEVFFEQVGPGYVHFLQKPELASISVMHDCAPILMGPAAVGALKYTGVLSNHWVLYGALEDL